MLAAVDQSTTALLVSHLEALRSILTTNASQLALQKSALSQEEDAYHVMPAVKLVKILPKHAQAVRVT